SGAHRARRRTLHDDQPGLGARHDLCRFAPHYGQVTSITTQRMGRHMKTWFITGASRGFGALIMEAALETDAVVATARDPSAIADHPRLLKLPLDVTDERQARDAVARGIEKFGRIDVLVNNAGYGLLGAVEEASPLEVERVFATNVFGLLNVTRAVLPYMRS